MFHVRWAKSVVHKEDHYFTTMVIPKAQPAGSKITPQNEPWVLAKDVTQCFFITDPKKPSRVVVRRGKRNIIGMDGVANEEDFDQFGAPIKEDDQEDEKYTTKRSRTTLPKNGCPFKRKSHDIGLKYTGKTCKRTAGREKIVKR